MTLVEMVVSLSIMGLALGAMLIGFVKTQEQTKYQSAYETSVSYAEQAMEYALYTPYSDFFTTNTASGRYMAGGYFYSNVSFTNFIATKYRGHSITLTNISNLATEQSLPLDDLGSYVINRHVKITPPTGSDTNLEYVLITVSNTWTFLGRPQAPIVLATIRNNP